MTTTSNFIGFDEGKKSSSRILKPPGGGSSILFDEPDGFHYRSHKSTATAKKEISSPATNGGAILAEKNDSGMSSGSVSPSPSGSITPSNNDNSGASSVASTSIPSSPQTKEPAISEKIETEDKYNGSSNSPFPNISKIKLDDVPVKTTLNVSDPKSPTDVSKPVEMETPASPDSKTNSPSTKGRLFGEENSTPGRVIKDRMKSSIFVYQDESPISAQNKSPSPEPKKVEQQAFAPPRQRIPPGGFSTKLW